ncbi:replication restart helicase PriA [Eggerthella lenta]|uniref:replication restart helicase PriA n=1 Tax=Eggerthella lenta TaxID=84112 RepID=UPI000DF7E9FA|nr:primosomal protein N' [Eggerthella lenta]MCG4517224.1 primosomal protein N' [Eggerthella lenta]MCG4742917.1 primosomal protein N' [Eggerthella lenta]MCG4777099.1 primosomal protein N' [Eggerthella lenta]MDB1740814.1 primosomal protein N' [Eggerthella lenta]MDB1743764.1 primosomal protein N' [Eggerthella lenta]
MKLASVILDIPTQALDAPYTYAVPEEAGDQPIEVGCAVLVPFGPRQAVGFIIGIEERAEGDWPAGLDPAKLKGIVRAVSRPYFDEEGAACAQWLSERYIAPLSSCVRLFTPPGGVPRMVRAQGGYWRLEEPTVGEVDDRWVVPGPALADFEPRKNAVKQASIAAALERGELRVAELTAEFGAVSSPLKALEKQGVVRIEHRRRMRGMAEGSAGSAPSADSAAVPSFTPSPKPPLTRGQADALAAIDAARSRGEGEVVLVDGVTGSGKTEVYLQAIEETLAAGRTACVLVPEISLTPQTVARFRGRFGDLVAVMHSRMSQGERYDQWDFIRSGAARVVVGARSALFTPLSNLGLIVIDEEHEGSYKQDSAPRYHARDVAVWMARRAGAAVVLGSATPSIEALHACAKNPSWHQVSLPERANGKPLPEVQVVDMAKEFSGGSRSMFALPLARALEEELAAGRKAVLLLNQRGFAKFLLCRECGFVPECPSCSTSLTYHERGNFLICHHCGYRIPTPPVCPECGSPYLKKFGAGTQRVEAELRVLLDEMPGVDPGVPIVRMDADTTSGKGAHQRLLEEFAAADAAVLLGTQMIAKGLDFEDVTLVGVINADTMLKLPDYRASERTFDLVEQVAGRAGRAELPGRVLVQTYEADAPAIRAAAAYDRALFLRDELPKRRLLGYPPYVRMANVLVWSKDEPAVRRVAAELQAALEEAVRDFGGDGWSVLPATPCVLAKLRGTYRWHIVVKCPADADLSDALLPLFRRRKPDRDANVAVDVDPDDLL